MYGIATMRKSPPRKHKAKPKKQPASQAKCFSVWLKTLPLHFLTNFVTTIVVIYPTVQSLDYVVAKLHPAGTYYDDIATNDYYDTSSPSIKTPSAKPNDFQPYDPSDQPKGSTKGSYKRSSSSKLKHSSNLGDDDSQDGGDYYATVTRANAANPKQSSLPDAYSYDGASRDTG